jgi:hypothetical protein
MVLQHNFASAEMNMSTSLRQITKNAFVKQVLSGVMHISTLVKTKAYVTPDHVFRMVCSTWGWLIKRKMRVPWASVIKNL